VQVQDKNTIIILIVLCAFESTRFEISKKVIKSINDEVNNLKNYKIFILENGSTYNLRNSDIPFSCTLIRLNKNVGYWSAIYYFLDYLKMNQEAGSYIYIVESDNYHYNMNRLNHARLFLIDNPNINSVRTQEFIIKFKELFSKESFLKFLGNRRSRVSLINAVTGEKAYFKKDKSTDSLYISNLHAKLPSLHRIEALRKVFVNLSRYSSFTEWNFFREMQNLSDKIGIVDYGCYFTLSQYRNRKIIPSGSWIKEHKLHDMQYLPTRKDKIREEELRSIIITKHRITV